MKSYFAQSFKIGGQQIQGPLKDINNLSDIVNIIVLFIYPLAGVLLFLYLVWGGYDFLLSRGNPEKIKAGQGKMTAAIVGFVLLIMSYLLVKLIANIFGLGSEILN